MVQARQWSSVEITVGAGSRFSTLFVCSVGRCGEVSALLIRREFIRLISLTAGGLPLLGPMEVEAEGHGSSQMTGSNAPSGSTDGLRQLFMRPPNAYRPMVRWWWNGDRVDGDEVLRELDVLQAAGIGGVEINPIRFPADADPMNTVALTWMSDEWIKVLEVALKGTKERGMTCDMIVGSGWPYGGEFLSREDQTQMVALGTRNLTGPKRIRLTREELIESVRPSFVSPYKDSQKELFGLILVPSQLDAPGAVLRMDEQLRSDTIELDVPVGDHVLYFMVKLTGFMAVINGAPGATGPVLNHYSAPAVTRYLDRLSDRLVARIGPLKEHFRAFFTDSIELEGANWCDDMFAEFRKRRGYDLSPWLPFVLFKIGEMGNAVTEAYGATFSPELKAQTSLVRYDFETTKRELFQERFVATFVRWCARNGVKSRMQAYGMDCDPIAAGMMLDIPECETWIRSERVEEFGRGDYRQGRSYTMINKFVSSAAHLAGKRLISCEEMTNTDDPFHTSLERIKVAGDQSMLSGVTQSVLHGFNYSPLDTPFPGWVRYGTYFSERNTWWPYFKLWTDYKARLSAIFQHAVMQADIAILPPMADLASTYGFQRDPFPKTVDPPYLFKLWEVIQQNGSGCDYLSEDIIERSVVQRGRLIFGERSYKAVLLPEVRSMRPATVEVLETFVRDGGTLIFIGAVPHQAPGLVDHAAESRMVQDRMQTLRRQYPQRAPTVTIDEQEMVNWYRSLQEKYALAPDVQISKPTDFVSQMRYLSGIRDIFFFANYGPDLSHTFEATFNLRGKTAWLWDAETGERRLYPAAAKPSVLTITLGPSESRLIVFEAPTASTAGVDAGSSPLEPPYASDGHPLAGPWNLELNHVNGAKKSVVLQQLADFGQLEDARSFAGTMIYKNHFNVESSKKPLLLDLGHLHCVSTVQINGRVIGRRWYGDQRYDLSGALTAGANEIVIVLVTTLGNYMKTLTGNKTAQTWTAETPFYPIGLTQTVRLIEGV